MIYIALLSLIVHSTTVNSLQFSNQIKCWFFTEKGKPEYPKKNLSEQSREPTKLSPQMAYDNFQCFIHVVSLFREPVPVAPTVKICVHVCCNDMASMLITATHFRISAREIMQIMCQVIAS